MYKLAYGLCPRGCGADVIMAGHDPNQGVLGITDLFDTDHHKMLVVIAYPLVDGKRVVALGPCQPPPHPPHRQDEEPTVYFAHRVHHCTGVA